MRKWLILSTLLHALVLLVLWIGLPHLMPEKIGRAHV
jgi:hypothetical protein